MVFFLFEAVQRGRISNWNWRCTLACCRTTCPSPARRGSSSDPSTLPYRGRWAGSCPPPWKTRPLRITCNLLLPAPSVALSIALKSDSGQRLGSATRHKPCCWNEPDSDFEALAPIFPSEIDWLIVLFANRGPKFDLVATATLCLNEVHDSIKSHDLILENLGTFPHDLSLLRTCTWGWCAILTDPVWIAENPCLQLPLFDHFCCRLAAQPDCLSSENATNVSLKYPAVTVAKQMKSVVKMASSEAPTSLFAVLRGFTLDMWKKREHREKAKPSLFTLTLDHVIAGVHFIDSAARCVGIPSTNFHFCFFYIHLLHAEHQDDRSQHR